MANRIVSKKGIKEMVEKISIERFRPTDEQRQFKIKYYNKAEMLGHLDPHKATLEEIQEMAGMEPDVLVSWWTPRFDNWFRDRQHVIDRLDHLFEESIERAAQLMYNAEKEETSLAAARFLTSLRKEVKEKEEKTKDDEASPEQLKKLIEQLGYKLPAKEDT